MNAPTVVLVDTGPLVALVNGADAAHDQCLHTMRRIPRSAKLITVTPVLTEAFYLVSELFCGQEKLFELLSSMSVGIAEIDASHLARMKELMKKYDNLPMDFADAALVTIAEQARIKMIATLDRRGFETYKPKHVSRLTILQ